MSNISLFLSILKFSNYGFRRFILDVLMHVCNREFFGYTPNQVSSINEDPSESFVYLRMEYLLDGPNKTYNKPLAITKYLDENSSKKKKTRLGFDQIYVINLERRPDRKERIEAAMNELNLNYKIFKAVDGKSIDEEYIEKLGVKSLPNYKDPYHDRPLNFGEIGCFLSHYFIWEEVRKV
jgi:collagen beta-1,O-galactosyltransferase